MCMIYNVYFYNSVCRVYMHLYQNVQSLKSKFMIKKKLKIDLKITKSRRKLRQGLISLFVLPLGQAEQHCTHLHRVSVGTPVNNYLASAWSQ